MTTASTAPDAAELGVHLFASALLIRPAFRNDESLLGYKLRVAHLNGINPHWLAVSREAGLTFKGLGAAHWCAYCIAGSDRYWRAQWETRDSACFRHHCWLSERCSGCGRQMSWRRARFDRCACGYSLADVEAVSFSPEIKVLLATEHPSELRELYLLSPAQRWNLARAVGAFATFGLRGKPFKRLSSRSPELARSIIERGAEILLSDERAISFLHRLRVMSTANGIPLVSEVFPGFLTFLRKNLDDAEQGWVLDLLDRYVSYTATRSSPVIWESKRLIKDARANSSPSAKPRAHRIVSVLADQGISPNVRRTKAGRLKVAISDSEWQNVERRRSAMLAPKTAARKYGLSVPRLRLLIQAKLIRDKGGRVDENSLAALVKCIVDVAFPSGACRSSNVVELTHALRLQVPLRDTTAFFDCLVRGSIRTYRSTVKPDTLQGLSVDADQIATRLSLSSGASMTHTIVEAARLLGLKDEVMYHLVNVGLVNTSMAADRRRGTRVVDAKELERFSAEVETLATACRRHNVSMRNSVEWARERGMKFVSGPTVDGGRQYFVLRTCEGAPLPLLLHTP